MGHTTNTGRYQLGTEKLEKKTIEKLGRVLGSGEYSQTGIIIWSVS